MRSGETTTQIVIVSSAEELAVEAGPTGPLDALSTATEQRYTAEDLRNLPVSSLEEALTLSGKVEGSLYFDVRNLLGTQNLVSVRPETGTHYASPATDRQCRAGGVCREPAAHPA